MRRMTNRIALLIYVAALGFAVLGANSILSLAMPRSPVVKRSSLLKTKIRGTPDAETGKVDIDDYVGIRPESFCGLTNNVRVYTQQTRQERQYTPATNSSTVYVLRGTILHSNPSLSRAFIEVPGASEQTVYQCGDSIHGAMLVSIGADSVELRRGEETMELTVSFEEEVRQGFQSPPPSRDDRGNLATQHNDLEEAVKGMHPAYREALRRATPEEQQRLMQMPPPERMKALRIIMKRLRGERRGYDRNNGRSRRRGDRVSVRDAHPAATVV